MSSVGWSRSPQLAFLSMLCSCALLSALVLPTVVVAADNPELAREKYSFARSADRTNMINGHFSRPESRDARRAFADWLLGQLDSLQLALKELTPTELGWIEAENKNCYVGDSDRCARFVQTDTYALWTLHREIAEAKSHLQCVIRAAPTENEMACWASASSTLNGRHYLDNAEAAHDTRWFARGVANEDGMAILLPLYGHGLLNAFVIPYLEGKIAE